MKKETTYKVSDFNPFTGEKQSSEYEVSSREEAKNKYLKQFHKDVKDERVKDSIKSFLKVRYVSGYKDLTKTTRCTTCGTEFSDIEIEGFNKCPSCGAMGVPMAISEDVEVKVNWHELRILTIWAENWARKIDKEKEEGDDTNSLLTIMCIAERLQKQFPDKTPLTLFSEIRKLRKEVEKRNDIGNIETNLDNDELLT